MGPTGVHLEILAPITKNSGPFKTHSVCFKVNVEDRFNSCIVREVNGF
jgi:hypothetical protein